MRVKVVTYNVLSSSLSDPKSHTACASENLDPDTRYQRVLAVLEPLEAEGAVLALQEVSSAWAGRLACHFQSKGYTLVFRPYGAFFDGYMGSALAVPDAKYALKRAETVRVSDTRKWGREPKPGAFRAWLGVVWAAVLGCLAVFAFLRCLKFWGKGSSGGFGGGRKGELFWEAAKRRYNCIVAAELEDKESGFSFVVGTYHMPCLFRMQATMVMHTALSHAWLNKFAQGLPYIYAGDFNAQPDSCVYQYLTTGAMSEEDPDYPAPMPAWDAWTLPQLPALTSAYKEAQGAEPDITNYSKMWKDPPFVGCLDYIFCSEGVGVVEVRSELPATQEEAEGPWPTEAEPSDHTWLWALLDVPQAPPSASASASASVEEASSTVDADVEEAAEVKSATGLPMTPRRSARLRR